MKKLTNKEVVAISKKIETALARNGIEQWGGEIFNPYLFMIKIPVSVGEKKAVKTFNDLFHTMGVLPSNERLQMCSARDYCACCMDDDGETYNAIFNHPKAMRLKEGGAEYKFTIKAMYDDQKAKVQAEEKAVNELIEGIKTGRLKSKSDDGYLVLKAEFYNAIEAGKKKIEYRDFSEYNIKRTIGLKTVRFNLGYAKDAKRMKWEVKKVVLMDDEDNECDPFNVPEDFWPVTIAIHLGKRIA